MKNSKSTGFVCIVVLALTSYLYSSYENAESGTQNLATVESKKTYPEIQLEQSDEQPTQSVKIAKEVLGVAPQPKASNKQSVKKHYDEDWCDARNELSASDYNFAKTELNDWGLLIGRARAGKSLTPSVDDDWFPNSSYIESYEALPIEQLQALALQEDKWAMVAFVQNHRADDELKDDIAHKLIVQGASYHAVEHLVMSSLIEAKISIENPSQRESSMGHVLDALVYAYWGLEHYNDSGIGSFNAITANEPFITKFPIALLLADSEQIINDKLVAFSDKIEQQRIATGIDFPEAPKAVQKLFAENIAIRQHLFKQQFQLLRSLNIINSNRLEITPCVKWHMADLEERKR